MWAEGAEGESGAHRKKYLGTPHSSLPSLLKQLEARTAQGPQSRLPGRLGGHEEGHRVSVVPQGQGSLRY